jgi:hypothetical protein
VPTSRKRGFIHPKVHGSIRKRQLQSTYRVDVFPPHLRNKTDPGSETLFLVYRIMDDGQSPETLGAIHHRQNPSDSTRVTSGRQNCTFEYFHDFRVKPRNMDILAKLYAPKRLHPR